MNTEHCSRIAENTLKCLRLYLLAQRWKQYTLHLDEISFWYCEMHIRFNLIQDGRECIEWKADTKFAWIIGAFPVQVKNVCGKHNATCNCSLMYEQWFCRVQFYRCSQIPSTCSPEVIAQALLQTQFTKTQVECPFYPLIVSWQKATQTERISFLPLFNQFRIHIYIFTYLFNYTCIYVYIHTRFYIN